MRSEQVEKRQGPPHHSGHTRLESPPGLVTGEHRPAQLVEAKAVPQPSRHPSVRFAQLDVLEILLQQLAEWRVGPHSKAVRRPAAGMLVLTRHRDGARGGRGAEEDNCLD